jgi:hypothetical protein
MRMLGLCIAVLEWCKVETSPPGVASATPSSGLPVALRSSRHLGQVGSSLRGSAQSHA